MKQNTNNNTDIIRVLAVAPYEGLKDLLEMEVRDFLEIQLDAVVGNLEEGVRLAQDNFHSNYDVIISRGGTANLLREQVDLPVIEIITSLTDILKAVQLTEGFFGKRAIVGFPNITERATELSAMLQLDIEIFTINDASDIYPVLSQLKKENYQTVICDVLSSNAAREAGFDTVLITSGSASVRRALQDVRNEMRSRKRLREENLFLRTIINDHSGDTLIFHENGTLFFSTLEEYDHELIEMLKDHIDEVRDGTIGRMTRSLGGYLYSIKASLFEVDSINYVAYYYNRTRSQGIGRSAGIASYTPKEVARILDSCFYRISGEMNNLMPTIRNIAATDKPALILGEYGTGRSEVAKEIYLNCSENRQNFVEIDCQMLNERSRDFLLNNQRSPLFNTGDVIHLMNIGFLQDSYLKDLFTTMIHVDLCRNNKVIFSGNPGHEIIVRYMPYIKDKFGCLEIELLPLRKNSERIPPIANLYLNQINASARTNVLRFDNEAIRILSSYSWPGNYTQFERILSQLCLLSKDHMIHGDDVSGLLRMESGSEQSQLTSTDTINLKRSLDQIEKEIIATVIRENNGNQSAAAKQLGISRTTLWRIYRDGN
ncbi:MAG: PrpR N-terminal domain-containing protein [Erysipelotrichaceae bacterium]|nr:PrpR N-terminal domain-containing protein [Erysipelotrichaceae bacterium]